MPTLTTSAVRREEIEHPVYVAGPVTTVCPGAHNRLPRRPVGTLFTPAPVAVPKSRCRYSARIVQFGLSMYSMPPPTVHPRRVSEMEDVKLPPPSKAVV